MENGAQQQTGGELNVKSTMIGNDDFLRVRSINVKTIPTSDRYIYARQIVTSGDKWRMQ